VLARDLDLRGLRNLSQAAELHRLTIADMLRYLMTCLLWIQTTAKEAKK